MLPIFNKVGEKMAAQRGKTPKCKWCGEWVDKTLNQFNKTNNGYYHNNCYQAFLLNKQHYEELCEYVSKIYHISYPHGFMLKQIKEFKEKRGYTYKGMELTLRYMYEIENKYTLDASESGLGLIPFYYDKARKHYSNMREVSKHASDIEIDNKAKIIYLKPEKKEANKKLIDMNRLIEED